MPKITVAGSEVQFDCAPGDTVLRAGLRAGLGMPYECNVGSCGTCKIQITQGAARHLEGPCPGLSDRDRLRGRMLACQAQPASDCVVSVHLEEKYVPRRVPVRQTAILESIESVTGDMSCFTLRTAGPASFQPGQYALVRLADVANWRAYSMANLPNGAGVWQFMIRRVVRGEASDYFFSRRSLGDEIEIDAPYGMAFYRGTQAEVVCIAGGSGIAPTLSIARAAASDEGCRRIRFYYGGRTPVDLCAQPYLETLARTGLDILHREVVSDLDAASSQGWRGPRGFMHEYLARALDPTLSAAAFYIAGPPRMVESVETVLQKDFAVPRGHIYYDRFY